MKRETRNRTTKIEIRAGDATGETTITGYAATFYNGTPETEYQLWEGAAERIMPAAFTRAINEGDDTRALFNHDANQLLGRVSAGTLKLTADERGLRYDIKCPDTQTGRDVAEMIRRGDVTGSSFGFIVRDEQWKRENGVRVREIHGVELLDVSPVTYPAYTSTTAGVRAQTSDTDEAKTSLQRAEHREELDAIRIQIRARMVQLGL